MKNINSKGIIFIIGIITALSCLLVFIFAPLINQNDIKPNDRQVSSTTDSKTQELIS